MSKIKVNEIEAQSGSTITIPTGQTLTVTDGMAASTITSGTLSDARLPTVPVSKGGTGVTSLGTAGQALKVNSGGTALEFGSAGVTELLGSGESSSVTSQAINSTILSSDYEVFEMYVFMTKVGSGGSGNREMFVSVDNGSNTKSLDRIYAFTQVYPNGTGGSGHSSQSTNADRLLLNVSASQNDFHQSKITILRPKFSGGSGTERNRNAIWSEAISCQNLGTSANAERIEAHAVMHHGNSDRNNDINYVRFEMNGATFDIKYAVYGRKW